MSILGGSIFHLLRWFLQGLSGNRRQVFRKGLICIEYAVILHTDFPSFSLNQLL
jgi:hypothetical protein